MKARDRRANDGSGPRQLVAAVLLACAMTAAAAPPPDDPAVDLYQESWTHRALTLQRRLDLQVPLARATVLATHNSYHSAVYLTPHSQMDPNQFLSLRDQLRMDMRLLELDVHWFESAFSVPPQPRPVLCHAQTRDEADRPLRDERNPVPRDTLTIHLGCSPFDRPLEEGFAEIVDWLDTEAADDDLLFIYLEDHLEGHYDAVISLVEKYFGDRVFRPVDLVAAMGADPRFSSAVPHDGAGCFGIPMDVSRAEILAMGKQVILHSKPCKGEAEVFGWHAWVFAGVGDRENGFPEDGPARFSDYPGCGAEHGYTRGDAMSGSDYEKHMVRFYEDLTHVGAVTGNTKGPISHAQMGEMMKCEVNLPSLDQLMPADAEPHGGRLAGAVWSWAVDEPSLESGPQCAAQGDDGRFRGFPCAGGGDAGQQRFPVACRTASGGWRVDGSRRLPWRAAGNACGGGAFFDAPFSGYDNEMLRAARAGVSGPVWINERVDPGSLQ